MQKFIDALKSAGAEDVIFDSQVGSENKDSLTFRLGGKVFAVDSLRGGEVLKGSCLVCDFVDAKDLTV